MADDDRLKVRGYDELPFSSIGAYPDLERCYRAWLAAKGDRLAPSAVDVDDVPKSVLPYVMLLDYLPEENDVEVRIAGNYVGERTTDEHGGRRLRDYFCDADAETVFASMQRVATTGLPSLAARAYVTIEGREYSYVRIILPLSANGRTVTGFFKTIEPSSLDIR